MKLQIYIVLVNAHTIFTSLCSSPNINNSFKFRKTIKTDDSSLLLIVTLLMAFRKIGTQEPWYL